MRLKTDGPFKRIWQTVRLLSGDDAYERYLEHWNAHHAHEGGKPLDRKSFFKHEQARKWEGVRRCC